MSKEAYIWAAEQQLRKMQNGSAASAKAVLLCLAWYADRAGQGARPSQETIASHTCLSIRSVIRALKTLQQLGLIKRQAGHNRHQTAVYEICLGDSVSVKGDSVSVKSDSVSVKSDSVARKYINNKNREITAISTDELSKNIKELTAAWCKLTNQLLPSRADVLTLQNISKMYGKKQAMTAISELQADADKMAKIGKPWRNLSIKAIVDRIERKKTRTKKTLGVGLNDAWAAQAESHNRETGFDIDDILKSGNR